MTQADWTRLSTRKLRSELAKLEKRLQRLLEVFPELEGPDTRILMRGLADFTRGGEWAEFDSLRSEIRAFKLELFRRDARMPDRAAEPSKSTAKPEPSPVLATKKQSDSRKNDIPGFVNPSKKLDPEVAKRRVLVRGNPDTDARQLCELLNREGVPLPSKWQAAGFKSWTQCYRESIYRKRIDVLFAKDRGSD